MPRIIGGSEKRTGSVRMRLQNGIPIIEETYEYQVYADGKFQNRLDIIATSGLPFVGDVMGGGFTTVRTVDATRDENNPMLWQVKVETSSEVDENNNRVDPSGTPPEAWIPVYETKYERLQKIIIKDVDGNPVKNSAGDPYDTGLTITRFIPIWTFYQFEAATISDETLLERNETINSTTFKSKAAKTLLCIIESSKLGFYYGARRRLTVYSLKYNSDKWQHARFDVGPRVKNGDPCLNKWGEPAIGNLNPDGTQRGFDQDPLEKRFEIYKSVPFSSFLRT